MISNVPIHIRINIHIFMNTHLYIKGPGQASLISRGEQLYKNILTFNNDHHHTITMIIFTKIHTIIIDTIITIIIVNKCIIILIVFDIITITTLPTPRNALFVRPSVRLSHFYAHLMRLLYFSNLANSTSPMIISVFLTTVLRSHGLSACRARRTKSSRPEGPLTRSWGPEGP